MIIRKLRLEKGYSQETLSDLSGVSVRTIQRIERGAAASPETLKCLAAVLDVDFGDLRKDTPMPASQTNPPPLLSPEERDAMEYVRDIKGFYVHLAGYLVAITIFVAINLIWTPGFFWAVFPAIGWGVGLAVHGVSVFELVDFFGRDWEKRKIAERLRR